ncbi:MAG: hypothetical protein GX220_05080 [Treponema sp.]|nr:hypothetical protein [Treponema sp.]
MKFILTADWHLRASRPRCRIDNDWIETQRNAINQVYKIALKKKSNVIIVGDIFNSNSDTSFQCIQLVQDFAKKLADDGLSCYVLAGNHDLLYHSTENIKKSAVGILLESKNIFLIKELFETKYLLSGEKINYSASNFDESDNKHAEMVFKHTLCFPDMKSIPPNVDAFTAKELTEEFPNATWIFTGDYHHNFYYEKNGKHVVNPGCLLRQAVDFKDYQCGVYFIDTDYEIVDFIPIIDNEQFVDDNYILKQEERTERIESFVDKLKNTKNISLDFIDNVKKAMKSNNFDSEMNDLLFELLGV